MSMTFEQWVSELRSLADGQGVAALLSQSDEDYREAFNDGMEPADQLSEEVNAASDSAREDGAEEAGCAA